ncbi:uncharacterized protein LOC124939212 isoform X2 [Impatiens glandulifera]|uniref:uncharacterized protein LOC124939212 isoform X2 n=1 Tax=Impatiens glandulifera TaxID=253017 RepID=UPI001FB054CE|nr:uncharacterized protein LOC124939212 isoform X2 [Impatiens glandulifera]
MALPSSSPAADTPNNAAAAGSTTAAAASNVALPLPRFFNSPPPLSQSREYPRNPSPQQHVHYQQQQQQQRVYASQQFSNLAPRMPPNAIHSQLTKPHDPAQGILYPVASSGRGFMAAANIRSQSPDQTVTIVNPGNYPSRPLGGPALFHHLGRPIGIQYQDMPGQAVQFVRPSQLQLNPLLGSPPSSVMPSMVFPYQPSVSDSNVYKDINDKGKDDTFLTVRDRRVRISEGSSLYALCRSWVRNGFPEESQHPQCADGTRSSLPKPLAIPESDSNSPEKNDDVMDEEEEEGSVDNLLTEELLMRHVKRAKRIRSRLKEERLHRILRYKNRLALLLPPLVDQNCGSTTDKK